ncbi:tRNA pseudouridine32 synthase / 23S rRNA pseudouridine746 synthase/23S rRNA pseudouridine1911/1915/1917 synthase [Mariniphaga anaerophila]|uniref:tRNA pseudouridine32 synthase / 23S rRNA pseudouridine746 synthase/23S rRNA pseudouridine1911/1915/1917 synthase n=1 Tax=Mariniphaga anaerophila TaxID=1484053 RepID=A0A1M4T495_9BACT|nr:RluA family pseudouridine synthase [Mariniphaga anaerophila]SHE39303.1 tRNA pseudouridine32 synthase / 23S rRNA pseudouridine746 synthase/23S rRNA pseudouridine1911/1915/1917 synthase [Mariniphaga anaerophila]
MHEKKTSYPNKTVKHQPRGMTILYEDKDIIVVDKAAGLLTMGTGREKENTAYFMLNDYVRKGNPRSRERIFIVHRLDRDTSGLLVFAKNEKAKRYLQDNWANFNKKYFAVVHGILQEKNGTITSYLAENSSFRMYSVTNPEMGKLSKTGYKVLKESEKYSLLEITLFTGRKNQIRVHFSEIGHPVVGDKIYGEKDKSAKRLALHSASLKILHPYTHKEMIFKAEIPSYIKTLVNE